jgi:chlorophyllide a reductase subunit X
MAPDVAPALPLRLLLKAEPAPPVKLMVPPELVPPAPALVPFAPAPPPAVMVLEPATTFDMMGRLDVVKPTLEVVYDEA